MKFSNLGREEGTEQALYYSPYYSVRNDLTKKADEFVFLFTIFL